MNRKLDGVYFRVKRNGKWESICFSDLTLEEREETCKNMDKEFLKDLACHLADSLKKIGDTFDICAE